MSEEVEDLRHHARQCTLSLEAMIAENERLRARLAKVAPAIIRGGLDLSSETLARMIWRMYRAAPDAWVPLYDLELEIVGNGGMPNENTTRVYLHRIRKALDEDFIETKARIGHRLSTEARARVAAIMGDI